jgi:hypothetical protein
MERYTLELLHGIGFSDPPRKVWPLRGETCCSSRSPVTHPMHFGGLRGLPGLGLPGLGCRACAADDLRGL